MPGKIAGKITDKYFVDWENHYFGFGYGTGEQHILPVMKAFFRLCNDGSGTMYDHEILEKELGASTAWLLINFFCHADMVEYGTSPRHGWLTKKGEMLKEYMFSKTIDDLYDLATCDRNEHVYCTPKACYCDEKEAKSETCNLLFL